ncbi:MAG: putative transposase [Anaerocolumna sp.]|jgi:transposase-like protein|nr:putative transposase [Anaerocolumna sp.]
MKKAFYIAIGIDMNGHKDVLYVGRRNENAKFSLFIMNSLKNRGVQDILIVCADNMTFLQ